MSFNIGHALTSGLETLLTTGNPVAAGVGAVAGGLTGTQSSQGTPLNSLDPMQLEDAFAQQPDCLQNVNQLSSFANSLSNGNDVFANLIDGDGDGN